MRREVLGGRAKPRRWWALRPTRQSVQQDSSELMDGRQRRSQCVRYVRDELILQRELLAASSIQLCRVPLQTLSEHGILVSNGRLGGEGSGHSFIFFAEIAVVLFFQQHQPAVKLVRGH